MGLKLKIKKPIAAAQVGGAQAAQVRATPHAPLTESTSLAQPVADQRLATPVSSAKAVLASATEPVKKKPKLKLKKPAASLDRQTPSALSSGLNHQHHSTVQPTTPHPNLVQIKRPLPPAQVTDVLPTKGVNGRTTTEPPKKKPKLKIKAAKPTLAAPKIERKVLPAPSPVLASSLAPALAPAQLVPPLGAPSVGAKPNSAKHTPVKIKLKASSAVAVAAGAPKKLKIKPSIAPSITPIKGTPVTRKPLGMPAPLEVKVKKKVRSELKGPQIQPPAARTVPPSKPAAPATVQLAPAPAVPSEPEALKEGTAFYDALAADVAEEELVSEKALMSMVNKLIRKDKDNTFKVEPQKGPLSSRIRSAYKAAIKHPMALTTIKESIKACEGLKMRTWHQMALALDLMVANCVRFNSADSPISKAAAAIRAEFDRIREKDKAAAVVAAAAADTAPGTEEAVEMPRLRSAMATEQQLPPRRAAAIASMMREHAAPRRAGRGGGRGPRAPHVNMRMVDHGIKRCVEVNARASFYKRTEDTACFGAALGGWNVETGRSWWLNRPKLGHAYPKKYIPFNFCALKTAFHVGRLREKMFAEIRKKAAHTVYCKMIPVPQAAPPAPGGQPPVHQAGMVQSRQGTTDQYPAQQQHSKLQPSSATIQRQPVQYQNHGYAAGQQQKMSAVNVQQQQHQANFKGASIAQQPKVLPQNAHTALASVQHQSIQRPPQAQSTSITHQHQSVQQKPHVIGAQPVQTQKPLQATSQQARVQQ